MKPMLQRKPKTGEAGKKKKQQNKNKTKTH